MGAAKAVKSFNKYLRANVFVKGSTYDIFYTKFGDETFGQDDLFGSKQTSAIVVEIKEVWRGTRIVEYDNLHDAIKEEIMSDLLTLKQ